MYRKLLQEAEWTYSENKYEWKPLPEWCSFFMRLGIWMAEETKKTPMMTAVSVPTRTGASALSAVGAVATFNYQFGDSLEEHFARLCLFNPGAPVVYLKKGCRYNGVIAGVVELDADPGLAVGHNRRIKYIAVQIQDKKHGGLRELISMEKSRAVFPSAVDVRLPANQKGTKISGNDEFIAALTGRRAEDFLVQQNVDCVLVGTMKVLAQELEDTQLSFKMAEWKNSRKGRLSDIVRIQSGSVKKGFNTNIISGSHMGDNEAELTNTPFAIFDGAKPYLNFSDAFPRSSQLVMLDRTDRNYADGVNGVNGRFADRGKGAEILSLPENLAVPPGVYVMAYTRGVK